MSIEVQTVYVDTPHRKQIMHAVKILERGGVIIYPTDTIYGLAADVMNKSAIAKILEIKKASSQKLLSFICDDLQSVSDWANVSNNAFRVMKRVLPGPYTFILPPTKGVPKSILEKRKTIGVRIPDSPVARAIVEELGRPLISTSVPKGQDDYFTDPDEMADQFRGQVDLLLDGGVRPNLPSTIVDFTSEPPEIIREGAGDVDALF